MRHTGDALGVPPTNEQLNISGISIVRIANSRLVESWQHWDRFGLGQFVSNAKAANSYAAATARVGDLRSGRDS